jgi:O-succinylbenzoic acid--CoA ligase
MEILASAIASDDLIRSKLKDFDQESQSLVICSQTDVKLVRSISEEIDLEALIWIFTSGSSNKKLIGLTKTAIFSSALSVCKFLSVSSDDIWAQSLSSKHIGGLAVIARSIVSGCSVLKFDHKWDPLKYSKFIEEEAATICSLVPTQIFDLVTKGIKAPPSLRLVLTGGAHLNPFLYIQAHKFGWPIIPSYGLSEISSTAAAASLDSLEETSSEYPDLKILPHLHMKINESGQICISGASILRKSIQFNSEQPKVQTYSESDYFISGDLGQVSNSNTIKVFGRNDRMIKINSHLASLDLYEELMQKYLAEHSQTLLFASQGLEDARSGAKVVLCFELKDKDNPNINLDLVNKFLENTDPKIPKVNELMFVDRFPLLANSKLDYKRLKLDLQKQ